ncbi:MAG: ATP-binding protein [Pseudomonadota bacterium]|nr:ATP-binding protein [Pseudomonadota bacterium]
MNRKKPILHLIHGFVGAGKTTFAKRLEQETGAVRFTLDEWMIHFYGSNPPEGLFQEYLERVEGMIWKMIGQFLQREQDVIFDQGFWTRVERDEARAKAAAWGATARLYALQCPDDVTRSRVLKRTADMPPGAMFIDENAIALFRTRFEPLGLDEEAVVVSS